MRMWKFGCVTLLLLVCLFQATSSKGDAFIQLKSLSKDYFDWRMSDRPETATYNEYYQYNDILETFLESNFITRKEKLEEFLTNLRNISRADLDKANKINYDILEDMLTSFIDGFKWRYYNTINPINFLEGPQTRPADFHEGLPFKTVGDFENYLARLERLPTQLDQITDFLKLAVTKGTAYHRVSMNLVLQQIDNICPDTNNLSINCDYFKPFEDQLQKVTTISQAKKDAIVTRGRAAIISLVTKYGEVKTYLETVYIPATRPNYGVVNLVNGTDYYHACLKWYLSLDMTPTEVHDIGRQEVERINGEMTKIMRKNNFQGSVPEYFEYLKNDSSLFFNTSEQILNEYRSMTNDRILPVLPNLFNNIPDLPMVVKAMETDGPAHYSLGSADGSRPGVFFANTLRPKKEIQINMMPLTMHEGYPGHHLQLSYNLLLKDAPDLRSKMEYANLYNAPFASPAYSAFVEGWALYSESLGEELKLYKDDNELMGRYGSEIFRACRLVVDTGLHYYNWTKDDAVAYMANYTFEPLESIKVEVDRYITWPGQACSYKIGEIKIKQLRKKASEELGDKFDLREFHTLIMEGGTVPLSLLERNINDWIEEKKSVTEPPPGGDPIVCAASNISQLLPFLLISLLLSLLL